MPSVIRGGLGTRMTEMAAILNEKTNSSKLTGKNDARHGIILNSRYSKRVLKSQQTCSIRENRSKLVSLLTEAEKNTSKTHSEKGNRLNGLLSVWDLLTADAVGTDGKEHTMSFLPFGDALEAFSDCFESVRPPYLNTDKDKFQYSLLHEQWGLCIYIITHEERNQRFIVLRPAEIDMELFFDTICKKVDDQFPSRIYLDKSFVQSLLRTMDSEWDRQVARVLLGVDKSRKELENLDIDSEKISRNVEKVYIY
jgi:hypothetical protein